MTNRSVFQVPSPMPGKKGQQGFIWAFFLVLGVAIAMRLYRVNEGLWLHEILTYMNFSRLPFAEIVTRFDSENQHFLYSILSHLSFLMFGESAWALRLPAALFGVGSLIALFLFGNQVTRPLESFLATMLMTSSYHHIWFSQNARGYTGLLFWTLLSSYLLLIGLKHSRWWLWLLFGLSAALGVYTHMTMVFVIFGQIIVYLLNIWVNNKLNIKAMLPGLVIGFGSAMLFVVILYAPVLSQIISVIGGSEASVVAEWKSPFWTVLEFIRGLQIGFSGFTVALIALGWFALGLYSYLRYRLEVFILLIVPPVLGALITLAIGHHLWPRFFFFSFGFLVLVVIRGGMVLATWIVRLFHWAPQRDVQLGTVLCCGVIAISAFSIPFAYGPKQDYQGAYEFILANRQPFDEVVMISVVSYVYDDLYQIDWHTVNSLDELKAIENRSERIWFIYSFPPVAISLYPEIMKYVDNKYAMITEFQGTVSSGTIFINRYDPEQ